jgi:hypothetical protein
MKIQNLGKSLAALLAVASISAGCASAPYQVKFGERELPAQFLGSLRVSHKEGHEIKTIWPNVNEVPASERSNIVSRIDKEMNLYDSEKITDLGLRFYIMDASAPSRNPKDTGKFKQIPYALRTHSELVKVISTNDLENTIHKSIFLTKFDSLSEGDKNKVRANYSNLRPTKEAQESAQIWDCHIANQAL